MNTASRRRFLRHAIGASTITLLPDAAQAAAGADVDVCIYGATASGIAAALGAADAGASVIVVEPSRWLGGMSGGGLGEIDWGDKRTVGRIARRLLIDRDNVAMRELFKRELAQRDIPVVYEHRLAAVTKNGTRIASMTLDHAPPDELGCPAEKPRTSAARTVAARVYVDCSYEGDLLAQAGVRYTWGRESCEEYGESLAGVRPVLVRYAIDPYVNRGIPRSGLLPLLQDLTPGPLGSADKSVMLYCFRWLLSRNDPIRIEKPDDYDPRTYEVFRRGFQQGVDMQAGRKMSVLGELTDIRGRGVFGRNSSRALWCHSVAGTTADYPDGDWATRSRIWRGHLSFIRGMYHFLRTDPAVPGNLRDKAERYGLLQGVFDDTQGWPHQLYVREARRMRSSYVVTQRDLEGQTDPDDAVGVGSYGVDDYPYATIPHEGGVALSGGEFSVLRANAGHSGIYKIPYRVITPRQSECENLLVPVCCSASHIAMTSLRMEPVWVTLGLSAGIAAAQAIAEQVAVQKIDFGRFQQVLVAAGQILTVPKTDG